MANALLNMLRCLAKRMPIRSRSRARSGARRRLRPRAESTAGPRVLLRDPRAGESGHVAHPAASCAMRMLRNALPSRNAATAPAAPRIGPVVRTRLFARRRYERAQRRPDRRRQLRGRDGSGRRRSEPDVIVVYGDSTATPKFRRRTTSGWSAEAAAAFVTLCVAESYVDLGRETTPRGEDRSANDGGKRRSLDGVPADHHEHTRSLWIASGVPHAVELAPLHAGTWYSRMSRASCAK